MPTPTLTFLAPLPLYSCHIILSPVIASKFGSHDHELPPCWTPPTSRSSSRLGYRTSSMPSRSTTPIVSSLARSIALSHEVDRPPNLPDLKHTFPKARSYCEHTSLSAIPTRKIPFPPAAPAHKLVVLVHLSGHDVLLTGQSLLPE